MNGPLSVAACALVGALSLQTARPMQRQIQFDLAQHTLTLPARTAAGLSPPDAIEAAVAGKQLLVRRCFAAALSEARPPTAGSSITLRFRVAIDGSVGDVALSNHGAGSAGECVATLARSWRFELGANRRATRVTYTWRYES